MVEILKSPSSVRAQTQVFLHSWLYTHILQLQLTDEKSYSDTLLQSRIHLWNQDLKRNDINLRCREIKRAILNVKFISIH